MVTLFRLFAEIERELLSLRTKKHERQPGPGGTPGARGKSKLDGKEWHGGGWASARLGG